LIPVFVETKGTFVALGLVALGATDKVMLEAEMEAELKGGEVSLTIA
jgi:hypothetical protein